MKFNFKTSRLSVLNYSEYGINPSEDFANTTISILSPNVTKALPNGWQNITTISKAKNWIEEKNEESVFLIIQSKTSSDLIGFIFLYPIHSENSQLDLRFGYLLSEHSWRKGLGTELVTGIVNKCQELGTINSISGGVELDNIGSIKVLEKCGFHSLSQKGKSENIIFYEKSFI